MHKWKGHTGCAGNMWCRRLETLTASVGLAKVAFPGHLSEVPCCCSLLLDQVLLSLPVVQCWCLWGVVCAHSRGGSSSPGLLAEPVGCGAITKAQTVLESLTSP